MAGLKVISGTPSLLLRRKQRGAELPRGKKQALGEAGGS